MMGSVVRAGLRKGDSKDLRIIESRAEGNGISDAMVENCIQISVYDTGIGIKSKDQSRVFEPFEQVEGSSSPKQEGTGLGLSLTKSLVELHGGKIWVESEGIGTGSVFHFLIPV